MRYRSFFASLAALLTAVATEAYSDHLKSACAYSEEVSGHFSSTDTKDILVVRVSGDPCYRGDLEIIIRSADDAILYEYSTPVAGLTAPPETDKTLHEYVRSWVKDTVAKAFSRKSDSLAPYEQISWREEALVPRAQYEAIRKRALPMLSHPAGEEGWRVVVADPNTGTVRAILAGSM